MATPEETRAAIIAMRERNAARAPTPESGAFDLFTSGMQRGVMQTVGGALESRNPGITGSLERFGGQPEPIGLAGRLGDRVGRGAPFAAIGLPAAVATGGLGGLALEITSGVATPIIGQGIEELGGGPGYQFAGEVLASIAAPAGALGAARRVARNTSKSADVAALAARTGASERQIGLLGKSLRRGVPVDPVTGLRMTPELIARLKDATKRYTIRGVRPSTAQAAGQRGGSRLARLESAAVRQADGEFDALNAGRQIKLEQYLKDEFESLLPNGDFSQAKRGLESVREAATARADELWGKVDPSEIPSISTARLKAAAKAVRRRVGPDRSALPAEVGVIEGLPDEIPATELQGLTSTTLAKQRIASRSTAETNQQLRSKQIGPIVDALQTEIRELPGKGSDAYRAARAATAELNGLFPSDSISIKALAEFDDAVTVARRLKGNSKNIEGEVSRVFRVLDQVPGASESLRRVVIEDLFSDELGGRSIRSVLSELKRRKKYYKAVLGEERYEESVRVAQGWKEATRLITSGPQTVQQTGSALSKTDKGLNIVGNASLLSNPANPRAWAEMAGRIMLMLDDQRFGRELLREALIDVESAAVVLGAPDPKKGAAVVEAFDRLVARVMSKRTAAIRASRVGAAATRSFGGGDPQQ